jgi:hypothetical protein
MVSNSVPIWIFWFVVNVLVIFLPTQSPELSSISWHAESIILGIAWLAHGMLVPSFTKMIKVLDAML